METLNAQIEKTLISLTGGVLTIHLVLKIQDKGGVSIGCFGIDTHDNTKDINVDLAHCTSVIMRILEVVGVNSWENLKGQYIRIKNCCLGDRVTAIGNLMKDEWVDFETFEKELI